jgi:hypothetical protein
LQISKNYYEGKYSKDLDEWREALSLEFNNIKDKKVWKIINKSDLPVGRKKLDIAGFTH